MAFGGKSEMSKISLLLITLSISFVTCGTLVFGIWGAPAAMILVYLILTSLVIMKLKKFSHAN
jgi:hypothetical protein